MKHNLKQSLVAMAVLVAVFVSVSPTLVLAYGEEGGGVIIGGLRHLHDTPSPTPSPSETPTPSATPAPSVSPTPTPEVLGASTVVGDPANLGKNGLHKGDLISAISANDPDVYTVNEYGYKRLLLNPAIFSFYFSWSQVHAVSATVRDSFPTSLLVRNCEAGDAKVYAMDITGEDAGTLRWVNLDGNEAVKQDASFFKKVFCISTQEFNWYNTSGAAVTSLAQVGSYTR